MTRQQIMKKDNSYCMDFKEHLKNNSEELQRMSTPESIRNEKYDTEAKSQGYIITDYKLFRYHKRNEILIGISVLGLYFLAGCLFGAL